MRTIFFERTLLLFVLTAFWGCGTPNSPVDFSEDNGGYKIVSKFATHGDANDIFVEDTLLYVAQGEGGLEIISVREKKTPIFLKDVTENARGYSIKLAKLDSMVYLAAGSYGVTAVNIADVNRAFVSAYNLAMKPARGLTVSNGFLFTAVSETGVKIASLSFPPEPDVRGGFDTPGYAQDLEITSNGNSVFVAAGEMGIAIFDISDMQGGFGNYPQIGWIDTQGYSEKVVLDETRKTAYVASGTAGVYAIDYSDLQQLKIIASYNTEGYAKDLIIDGEKLYVTSEKGGVYFFDISNVAKLNKLGRIKTNDARGISMDENYIYVADKELGIIIIKK